ncbi:MAG: ABC transporter permease [Lachnospiraceae bacterium]|nr:ABC transporter permease [Lachnospiraceae bacterium]
MSNNKSKESAFTNNPIVRAIGTQKIVVIIVLLVLFGFFCIMSPAFRNYSTILSIFDYSYYITFMAIGVTFALITGGVDLSIGTGMICYGLIGGYLITQKGMPVVVGIIVTILVAMLIGTLNGVLVAILNLPPFIATLGTMMLVRGLGSIITGGISITWPPAGSEQGWFRSIFKISIGEGKFPIGFIWVILIVVIMSLILNKSKIGRYIIAIGSNKEATRLSGVNVIKYHMIAYIISGFFTGLAAVAYAATFQAVAPGTGAGLELDAIGGAIIGGTSMTGGSGSIVGTLLGVFIMSMLKTGLPFIGLQANWQQIITGLILIGAVFMDVMKKKKKA